MKMNRRIYLTGLCIALALAAPPVARGAASNNDGSVAEDTQEDQLYSRATQAINEGRWSDAEPLLDQVSSLHGRRSDAALYWKAYVKNKEGRPSDAVEICATLRQTSPQSNWLKECGALQI